MGALRPLPDGAAERLAPLLKEARSKAEYQRVQCVWLRATLGLNSRQVAEALWAGRRVRCGTCRLAISRKGKRPCATSRTVAAITLISRAQKNRNCWLPFWREPSREKSLLLLRCSRPIRSDSVMLCITRSSIGRCIARAGARSSLVRDTRRRTLSPRKNLKKAPGTGPRRSKAVFF